MTLKGIQTVAIQVSDVETSCDFYENVLKLDRVYESMGRIAFAAGGTRLLLHPIGAWDPHDAPIADYGNMLAVYWNVDDVDSIVESARSAGRAIAAEPADEPWGERDACILDPDGYCIYVTQSEPHSWLND